MTMPSDLVRERFELDCRLEDLSKLQPLDQPPEEYRKKFRTVQAVREWLNAELRDLDRYHD